ncbi:Protein of unknown function DUF1376 [uncultured Caudovirales phage]|uniref:DUF1376 domain-containing protein n=1 Tax=uncultured Caudovirales phage TaxID=2100421 RepID=A0A6J5RSH3_9CAUD|nr:Protein of unknown function DUF1376 [uncultured Caudovirales phage]
MRYFKLHIGDFVAATARLSLIEEGIYMRLLIRCYQDEKPLPIDLDEIARMIGARRHAEKVAMSAVVRQFFSREEDGWHQKRVDAEIEKYAAKVILARSNGQSGGRHAARQREQELNDLNELGNQDATSVGVSPGASGVPNQEPRTMNHQSKDAAPPGAASGDLTKTMFDQGIAYLTGTGVKSDQQARALLGKWKKALGSDGSLIELLATAQRQGVVEPVGWMTKAIQAREPTTPSRGWN